MAALALALALGAATACGVKAQFDGPQFEKKQPRTLAVLPFRSLDDDPVSLRQAAFTRQAFVDRLLLTPYSILEPRLVDRRLRKLGIARPLQNGEWPAAALRALQVDAALAGELSPFETTNFGLYTGEHMEGRFRLFALPEGDTLWEAQYDMRQDGGLIINSGQVLAEIERWSEPLEELYAQGVDKFVNRVVETFPPYPGTSRAIDLPEVGTIAVTPSASGTLGLGDRIDFSLQASPGLRIRVRFADGRRTSLVETASGQYQGAILVTRGQHFDIDRLDMDLVNPFGEMFVRSAIVLRPIQVDARPTGGPTDGEGTTP